MGKYWKLAIRQAAAEVVDMTRARVERIEKNARAYVE